MEGVCDTPLHLFVWFMDNTMVATFIFSAMEGVCDTPLHLFVWFMDNTMVEQRPFSPPWRAYAIRPYGLVINRNDLTNCTNARVYALKWAKMKTTPTYWCIQLYCLYLSCKKFYREAWKIMLYAGFEKFFWKNIKVFSVHFKVDTNCISI